MILYLVHGNTYYEDSYGYIENIFGIYMKKMKRRLRKI